MTLATISWSLRPPTDKFPTGYGKIESLGSLGVSSMLFFGGVWMGYGSLLTLYGHFFLDPASAAEFMSHVHTHSHSHGHDHAEIVPSLHAAWLAAGTVAIKEWLYHATMKVARERKSSVLASNAVHHRVDSLTGIVTLAVILGANFMQNAAWLDPVGGLLISLMVVKAGAENTISALFELADRAIDDEVKGSIRKQAQKVFADITEGHEIELRGVSGVKSGQNYLVDLEMAVPNTWTLQDVKDVEDRVRTRVGAKVRGVRRVRVRFIPKEVPVPPKFDEFIPGNVSPRSSPEPEEEDHDHGTPKGVMALRRYRRLLTLFHGELDDTNPWISGFLDFFTMKIWPELYLSVVSEAKVDFDDDFASKYGIKKGVQTNEAEGEVYAPVAMWLDALELVLNRLKEKGCPVQDIRGVSGSGQQHGSVYWNDHAEPTLKALDPKKTLLEQLSGTLSYEFSPNWQDHSTQAECDQFDAHLGSAQKLAEVTGSSAHHRFTGTQILRMRKKRPQVYASTARISLVSSFLASCLVGAIAPIDCSDVTGMNLWDIAAESWSEPLLELTAGKGGVDDLRKKLGEVRMDGGGSIGNISPYYVERFGFSPECRVVSFTGDNPATILSLPLRPMDAIVSLGTSSTFLMNTPTYKPDPAYHFMNHPTTKGHFMFMLCYKNGGLAREKVRDRLPKPSSSSGSSDPWETFNKHVLETPPLGIRSAGDRAKLGLYFPLPEIVPNIRAGTWRYTCKADGSDLREEAGDWGAEADARAIVESQALSMRLRSHGLVHSPEGSDLPPQPRRIYIVGGGSHNPAIARVIGDVLGGADGVYKLDVGGNACALGGAYKAVWALERSSVEESFDDLIGRRWDEASAVRRVEGAGFRDGVFQLYGHAPRGVLGAFDEMEQRILKVAKN
ncbi:hypothetical protein DL767_004664 [Monosporascus sp. MG133]|nr:hypothetical protein DL767_004664 [Monosporascus sp. MG133]